MNQILYSKDTFSSQNIEQNHNNKKSHLKKYFLKFQFFICLFACIGVSAYYLFYLYNNDKKEKLSEKLVDNFNITNLYNDNNYTATKTLYETNNNSFYVIGLIEIPSININYPILSTINDDLLKIAPCRFYGPMPNEIGNMCIAAHNYNSYKFFSKIKNLKNGDIINIYDLSGRKISYAVYNSFEIDSNDLSCTNQQTNEKKELTLLTCNNIKNRRRVVKAIEKT